MSKSNSSTPNMANQDLLKERSPLSISPIAKQADGSILLMVGDIRGCEDSLNIFGFPFAVIEDDRIDENGNSGELNFDKLLIRISPVIAYQQKEETLLHEIIHAVNHCQGMAMQEKDVIRLSHGLYSVLANNQMINFERFLK